MTRRIATCKRRRRDTLKRQQVVRFIRDNAEIVVLGQLNQTLPSIRGQRDTRRIVEERNGIEEGGDLALVQFLFQRVNLKATSSQFLIANQTLNRP